MDTAPLAPVPSLLVIEKLRAYPHTAVVISVLPSNGVPLIRIAVFSFFAELAGPLKAFADIVAGNFKVTLPLPLTLVAVPVLVAEASAMLMFLAVPHSAVVISADPSNAVLFIFLAVFNLVAVDALPVNAAFIVAGNFRVTLPLPLTLVAVPVLVAEASAMLMFLAVPQLFVVIAVEPSKLVPFIARAVANLVAVVALPVKLPVILGMVAVTPFMFVPYTYSYGIVLLPNVDPVCALGTSVSLFMTSLNVLLP